MEVASAPFLQNIAQSACATMPTKVSASSTMAGPGPVMASPSAFWSATAFITSGCP